MADKLSSPVARELVAYAKSKGFAWGGKLSGKGHIILRHPGGGRVTLAATPTAAATHIRLVKRTIDREAERGR